MSEERTLTPEEAEAAVRVGIRRAFGDMSITRSERRLDERAEWRKVRAHAFEQTRDWCRRTAAEAAGRNE